MLDFFGGWNFFAERMIDDVREANKILNNIVKSSVLGGF